MSELILNDSFNPDIFTFEMLPPYIVEKQHEVQNGNLLTDIIAYKDRFQINWPWLTQTEYNSLIEILYSLTDPYITVEYNTDAIVRIWDDSTSFSSDISLTLLQDPIFDYFDYQPTDGLLIARASTNLFINPNGDSGTLTNVKVEDSVTTKKNLAVSVSSTQSLWGTHSFKADNTNSNDFTPETGSSVNIISNDGRPDYSDSGSLQITDGYTSELLYNHNPFTTYLAQWTTSYGTILGDEVYGPAYCYRDEIISPASDTYTFQVDLSTLSGYANAGATITLVIDDLAGQSAFYVYNISTLGYFTGPTGYISITKVFSGSVGTSLRCRLNFANIEYIKDNSTYKIAMQLIEYVHPLPWVDTGAGSPVVVSEYSGLLYKAPMSLWSVDGIHYEPPTNPGETQSPQSLSLWFRSTGWYYDTAYSDKYYIVSSLDNTGHSGYYVHDIYIENGYIKMNALGESGQYQITSLDWNQLSWHHLLLIVYPTTEIGSVARTKFVLYIDGVEAISLTGPYASGLTAHFIGNPVYNEWERYFSIGRMYDLAKSAKANTIGNMAFSEIVIGQSRFDTVYSNSHPTLLLKEALEKDSTIASYDALIKYDESFSFYLRGNSENAYISRCLFFDADFSNSVYEKFVGSCYIYPTMRNHKYLHMIQPYSVEDSFTAWVSYVGGETSDIYTPDNPYSGEYLVNNWYRSRISTLVFQWPTGGTSSGLRRVFGVFVPMGEIYYICGVQFETVGTNHTYPEGPTPYCDGNQTNCVWDGTQYSSTSSRTNEYVVVPFPSTFLDTDSWTFLFSCLLTEMTYLPGDGVFLTIGDNATNKLVLKYYSDIQYSYLLLQIYDVVGNLVSYTENMGWNQDIEHSVAVVKNVEDNTIKIYFDFVLVFTHTFTSLPTQFLSPTNIYLGSTGPNDASPFYSSAFLRNVSLWKKVLSEEEIRKYIPCRNLLPVNTLPNQLYYFGSLADDLVLNANLKINSDVKRIRKKVLRQNISTLKHVKNRANYYNVKVLFRES